MKTRVYSGFFSILPLSLMLAVCLMALGCVATAPIDPMAEEAAATGDYSNAIAIWSDQARDYPEDGDLVLKMAKAFLDLGLYQIANPDQGGDPGSSFMDGEALFKKALKRMPDSREAGFGLARALYQNNSMNEAKKVIESTLEAHPGEAELLLWAGRINAQLGEQDQAKTCFKKALAVDPTLDEAYLRLGDCFLNEELVAEALAIYQEGVAACPAANSLHERLLFLYNREGGLLAPEAIAFYEGLLTERNEQTAGTEIGSLWWFLGTWNEYLGGVHYGKGEFKEAKVAFEKNIHCLEKCVQAFPDFKESTDLQTATALTNVAYCEAYIDEYDDAREHLYRALELNMALDIDPSDNPSLLQAVDVVVFETFQNNGAEKALELFRGLTQRWEKRHQWWNDYGFFSLEVNMASDPTLKNSLMPYEGDPQKYEETHKAFSKALALNPGFPRYTNDVAMVIDYYLDPLGARAEEVETMYREAWTRGKELHDSPFTDDQEKTTLFSAYTDAMVNLIRLTMIQGRLDESEEILQELAAVVPNRTETLMYQSFLEQIRGFIAEEEGKALEGVEEATEEKETVEEPEVEDSEPTEEAPDQEPLK